MELDGVNLLEEMMKKQLKIDYTQRKEKFIVLQDDFKKIIGNLKDANKKPLSRDAQRRVFVSGMVFIKSMNDAGFFGWFPDRVKDSATKLFLMNMVENETFIKEML